MAGFIPIFAAETFKTLLNAFPLIGGIAAGLLTGLLISLSLNKKKKKHGNNPTGWRR